MKFRAQHRIIRTASRRQTECGIHFIDQAIESIVQIFIPILILIDTIGNIHPFPFKLGILMEIVSIALITPVNKSQIGQAGKQIDLLVQFILASQIDGKTGIMSIQKRRNTEAVRIQVKTIPLYKSFIIQTILDLCRRRYPDILP